MAIKCSSKHHADILNIKYKHLPSKIFPRRMFGTKVVRDKSQITIRHITQDGWHEAAAAEQMSSIEL